MTDSVTVQERIIALCKLITLPSPLGTTDALKAEEYCSFADADLPVFIVRRGPGSEQYPDTSSVQITREYLLKLYVQRICDTEVESNKETALALAADCILPTLFFFAQRQGLSTTIDGADAIVDLARIIQDSGDDDRFNAKGDAFSGVLFRMQVITRHHAEGATLW